MMDSKKLYTQYLKWFPAFLLLLFFITEAFSKFAMVYLDGKSDIQRYVKLIVLVIFVFGIIKPLKNLLLPALLFGVFCLGQLFLEKSFNQEVIVGFSKLLFPIILFTFFIKHPVTEKSKSLLFKVFEYLMIFNGLLILIGLIFEIPLFNSYRFGRWGYNGLLINTSTSSYIYAIALFYFLISLKHSFLKNWKSLFIIVSCLLTGTKIVYIALLGSLFVYIFYYTNLNRKHRSVLLITLLSIFSVLGYILFFHWGIFNEIRQEQGLVSAILSYRDDLLIEQTIPFIQQNWQWPNYIFGGINNLALRSQMGFVDVFLFWGILGGIIYLFAFYKNFVPKSLVKNANYIILILSLMVFLAGNFFENASVAIYLLVLKEILMDRSKPFTKVIAND